MSGRLVNVRPKPGFLMDGAGEIIPTRQNVIPFMRDRLTNVMTGMGTTADRLTSIYYAFAPMSGEQAEASYRQSWVVKKLIDIPAKDMTREWRDWKTTKDKIEALEEEERRLHLRARVQRCLILARLFGGAGLVLGTEDSDQSQPLDPKRIRKSDLKYVRAMSRYQLVEGPQREDPLDPWVDEPEYYTLSSRAGKQVKLHPSRVVPFIGQKAPEGGFYTQASWFWGDPVMQSIGEAVKNADLAQSGFASLIDRAAVDVFKFKDLMSIVGTQEGEDRIKTRAAWATRTKSSHRAMLIDMEDDWKQVQASFANVDDTLFAFLQIVCGAADIPVTRFLSQSPKGLQSTGEGEAQNYNDMVSAWQEDILEPALDRTDEVLLPSALGAVPSDVYYEFAPLGTTAEKDEAEIETKYANAFKTRMDTGAIPDDALAKAEVNRMIESGRYPGLEAAIEELKKELGKDEEAEQREAELQTLRQQVGGMQKRGAVTKQQANDLITDAKPRSLYIQRKLLNGAAFIKWAKAQGFATTVPADDLHVTVCFSRTPVDWIAMGSPWDEDEQGRLKVKPGGARIVEKLGDKGAVVLLFNSSQLSWRHEELVRKGASHDFDSYQPHVTITYEGSDVDLEAVEPYRGELLFGPEIFEEVVEDWEKSLTEA